MVNVDGTCVLHAARQECVSDGAEEHDRKNDEIFTKRQKDSCESKIKTPGSSKGRSLQIEKRLDCSGNSLSDARHFCSTRSYNKTLSFTDFT
jgi:hypothetical protein